MLNVSKRPMTSNISSYGIYLEKRNVENKFIQRCDFAIRSTFVHNIIHTIYEARIGRKHTYYKYS